MGQSGPKGVWGVLLVAALLLAGCGAKGKPTAALVTAGPAEFDEGTGGIEGVVTDDEDVPIEGVTVGIPALKLETRTDSVGYYSLSHVEPGSHSIFAALIGYTPQASTVAVEAGVATTDVNFLLKPIPAANATYSRHEELRGFIACGTGTFVLTQVACGQTDSQQQFLFEYEITPNMTGVLWEQVWTPTQLLSKDLVLNIERDGCGLQCDVTFASATGCCKLRIALEGEKFDKGSVQGHTKGATIQSRTFPAFRSSDGLPTVYTQQAFTIYIEYLYGTLPEDFLTTRTNVPA